MSSVVRVWHISCVSKLSYQALIGKEHKLDSKVRQNSRVFIVTQ